ncbi:hypothetical protein N7492_009557 [Penicillium capsulatum]|uniref:Uncharacterized protein n=1 Tax=Penicillium capsulatum TaxID=69766 RepID=A0A9W9HXD1_9EURO|nr:hypothetical protein N7492_009557 [Penicillium capsulatum]KAJ6106945.1 hypothetical protein N7512_010462 [Penicillium capsulatum]
MSAVPTTAASAANTGNAMPSSIAHAAGAQEACQSINDDTPSVDWDSEIQLVSSLAKLQELERQIHSLRQLLPDGLLEPLLPISNPNQLPTNTPVAGPPTGLRNEMQEAARSQLAMVDQFQSMWHGPELKPVWAHVESRIKESNGQYLQPSGVWEKDYDVILDELTKSEKTTQEEQQCAEEESERAKLETSDDQYQDMAKAFAQRDIPGVRVIIGNVANSFLVVLARAGIIVIVQGIKEPSMSGVSDWQVSSKRASGQPPTQLELDVLGCLRSRPRKWDLTFLLEMILSYADIKKTPCVRCNRLVNDAAQLPTARRAQSTQAPSTEARSFTFDALHANCA